MNYPSPFARLQHVLELRREGLTHQQIADRVGVKPAQVSALLSKAIKRMLRETAEEVRQLELSRVEVLINALWELALKDIQGAKPDFQRFDRIKGLLETKLRFCGAQAVVEGNQDNRVQIIIQQFTDRRPKEVTGAENPNPLSGVVPTPPSNADMGGHGSADYKHLTLSPPPIREG